MEVDITESPDRVDQHATYVAALTLTW